MASLTTSERRSSAAAPGVPRPEPGDRPAAGPDGARPGVATGLALLLALGGCEAEWSGTRIAVERPQPPDTNAVESSEPEGPPPVPLPSGPLLYYVAAGDDGRAFAVPVARAGPDGPERLVLPDSLPPGWAARFDSTFYPAGRQLALQAGRRRIGTLLFTGASRRVDGRCPAVAEARVLVPPGRGAPERAFALPDSVWPAPFGALALPAPDPDGRRVAPVLAERLLSDAGVERPYLARRADLQAIEFPGEDRPGMAATYLIGDTLARVPPRSEAASLFFLTRFVPQRGFVPQWSRVHRYGPGEGKRIYTYAGAVAGPGGGAEDTVHFLRVHGSRTVRLASLSRRADGFPEEPGWEEDEGCAGPALVESAAAAGTEAGGQSGLR